MSAAERARLARAARAVMGGEAGTGAARASTLRRLLSGREFAAGSFSDLAAVPEWLPADSSYHVDFSNRAALAALSPALARTLDGATLRGFAAQAGDAQVDWALNLADRDDAPAETPPLHPEALPALGRAIVGTAVPQGLRDRFPEAPPLRPDHIAWSLARAREEQP